MAVFNRSMWIIILISILILFTIAYHYQDRLIFQSKKLNKDFSFSFEIPYEEYFIEAGDNILLNALWFKPTTKAKGIVIYFHGNADNLQRWGNYAVDFTKSGYEVVMVDYRGYGKSNGTPSEEVLYSDAKIIWNWVKTRTTQKRFILYGRSLGSPIATRLAAGVSPDLLILETPFDELRNAMLSKIFFSLVPPRHRFPTKIFLAKATCRKVIFHGTDDWVVPLSSAENLKPLLSTNDEFIVIKDGGHRNLRAFSTYQDQLERVLLETE